MPRFSGGNNRFKFRKKKKCPFCKDKVQYFDYKDVQTLERFINEKGKIAPRRSSGCCAKHQRKIAEAIKKARNIALLPFIRG